MSGPHAVFTDRFNSFVDSEGRDHGRLSGGSGQGPRDGFYLEDMIVIEPNGYRLLTAGLPYTAAEIEATMARAPTRR